MVGAETVSALVRGPCSRQVPIGPFTVDFAIHEHRLIIEVDGEHHFTADGLRRDMARDAWLAAAGYRVLRFNTGELSDAFDGCVEEIIGAIGLKGDFMPLPTDRVPAGEAEGER